MPKIVWDNTGERLYETGVSQGVLYPMNASGTYGVGVPWNGLTSVSENPSGAEETALWANNRKYLSLRSKEEFGATIEAYTYPDEWAECDGSASLGTGVMVGQQTRKSFGLCYRTELGNDSMYEDYGYKLHIIYNAKASPSQKSYATINDSPEAITFSYDITTVPVEIPGALKDSATITIDSTKFKTEAEKAALKTIEDMLYGTDGTEGGTGTDPQLPSPTQIKNILDHITVTGDDGDEGDDTGDTGTGN